MTTPPAPEKPFPSRRKLGELLVTAKLISPEQRNEALVQARKQHMRLGQYLVLQKVIKEIHLAKAISFQLKVEMYNPKKHHLDETVKGLVTEQFAFESKLCPVFRKREVLYVAMLDPTDMHAIDEIVFNTHLDVEPLICTREHLTELHKETFGIGEAPPLDDTLVLKEEIDMAAVQDAGSQASIQGNVHATTLKESSTMDPLDMDAMSVSELDDMPSLDLRHDNGEGMPETEGVEELDVLPYVEAVEEVPGVEVVPDTMHGDGEEEIFDTSEDSLLCLNDAPLARRIDAVARDGYDREEVVRAALMLGLAVLEEEPGLVSALNMRNRDTWM